MTREVAIDTVQVTNADASAARSRAANSSPASTVQPGSLGVLAPMAAEALGARSGRLFIVDYGLRRIRSLDADGTAGEEWRSREPSPVAPSRPANRATGRRSDRDVVAVSEGSERIGLLELTFDEHRASRPGEVADVVRMMVLLLVSGRRYTDVLLRARRVRPLSEAAEAQWDLLPPLSYAGPEGRRERHPRAGLRDRR